MKTFKKYIDEMGAGAAGGGAGPTNTAGSGQVAGIGVGSQGEPGVDLRKHKKKVADPRMSMGIGKRKDF